MKLKKLHIAFAALVAGSVYALAAMAMPGNAITVDQYTLNGNLVGEIIVFNPCYYPPGDVKPTSWGVAQGVRKRIYVPCSN